MTVPYTREVATSTFACFVKLLFRWRGSIYKLIWKDFLTYIILYYVVRFVYRYALTEKAQRNFESLAKYSDSYVSVIPLSFVLGFYVQQIVARWHLQFETIPYPDSTAVLVTANVKGLDERGRLIRRTMIRYLMLGYVMTMRSIAPAVKKRFPTMKHLTEAGLMSSQEERILENINVNFNKYSIPFIWATSLVSLARKEGRIYDDYAVQVLNDMFNNVRQRLNRLFLFDWVGIPLVYTQVVTLSVYLYFVLTLFSQQFLLKKDGLESKDVDLIVPVAAILQFFFFMGWLKVAETLINPFGEDDDDFEINAYIDRNMQLAYLVVDGMHADHPPLVKDMYWGTQRFELPYTEATIDLRRKSVMHDMLLAAGSAAGVTVPKSMSGFVHTVNAPQDTSVPEARSSFALAVTNLPADLRQKLTNVGSKITDSRQDVQEMLQKSPKLGALGTEESSESAYSLAKAEKPEKSEKSPEAVKLVGILKKTVKIEKGVPTYPQGSDTQIALDQQKHMYDGYAVDDESLLDSRQSASEDDVSGYKPMKVIDLPMSPNAVKLQRQQSFSHHIDKVHRSRAKEYAEGAASAIGVPVQLLHSGVDTAIKTIRRILTHDGELKDVEGSRESSEEKRL